MEWRVDVVELLAGEVLRVGERLLADGTDESEWRVEDKCGVGRAIDVLIGVADGDGPRGGGEPAAHTAYHERDVDHERNDRQGVITEPGESGLRAREGRGAHVG